MRDNLVKFSSILLYFLPAALISGPLISDIILSVVALIFIFLSAKEKLWKYYKNNFFYIFSAFYFYILCRTLLSEDPSLALINSLFYFRFGIFSLAVWYLIDNNSDLIKRFFFVLSITLFILIFDAFIQIIFGQSLFGMEMDSGMGWRHSGLFGDEAILGSYLSKILPLYFALMLFSNISNIRTKFLNYIFFIIFVSGFGLIYMSGERTAFFVTLITFVIVFIMLEEKKIKIIFGAFLISGVLLIVASSVANKDFKTRMIDQTLEQIGVMDKNFKFFSTAHQSHYQISMNMFWDNPVFGKGPKTFRKYCSDEKFKVEFEASCSTHPHNYYVQMLAETGLLGFLFLVLAFFYVCKEYFLHKFNSLIHNKKYLSDYEILLLSCFFISLWPIAPSGNIFNNWLSIIMYLPLGFYLRKKFTKTQI